MSETVLAIVSGALRLLKVKEAGEAPTASEGEDGRIALNDIIETWNLEPLMQPAKVQLSQALTTSATYTFGTGGDNATRPVAIHSAFIRDSGGVDHKVRILTNEEYTDIPLKTVSSSYPYDLYYRNSYPLGVVNLFPVPRTGYTLYMQCQAALSTFPAVSTVVNLPPGYIKALKYALAIAISPEYKDPSQIVLLEAENTKALIKRMNAKDKPVMANPARAAVHSFRDLGYLFGTP